MSELILKAILRLFAIVAKQDDVTKQEREQIRVFLKEHLAEASVEPYLQLFDEYAKTIVQGSHNDTQAIQQICLEINEELTQKQKVVIVLELVKIVLADESVSEREEESMKLICDSLKVKHDDLASIRKFVVDEGTPEDYASCLIIDSSDGKMFKHSKHKPDYRNTASSTGRRMGQCNSAQRCHCYRSKHGGFFPTYR